MILATFPTEPALMHAVEQLRAGHTGEVEIYTPTEPEPSEGGSCMPLVILVCGVAGAILAFLMQAYADAINYPLNIGGRPDMSWPAYIPTTFELGVLAAMLGGFFGYMIVNRLPRLYEPIDESEAIRAASRNGYVVAVREPDRDRTHAILAALDPLAVEEVAE